jgi:amino acid transporter
LRINIEKDNNLNSASRGECAEKTGLPNLATKVLLQTFIVINAGVSFTLGASIFILAGNVMGLYTGPAIVLSFLLAGMATLLSGLCYAELGAR